MVRVKTRPSSLSQAEREERIHRALAKKAEFNTPWAILSLEFGIPASTLNDRFNGRKNRKEAHQSQQKLPPVVEKALVKWCQDMDDAGFPPRVDLLRGMATALAQKIAEEEHLGSDSAYLGKNWISRFLDRHPELAAKYSTQLDRQRQLAHNPIILRDYFSKLARLVRKLVHLGFKPDKDTYNFDEKGFILGYSSRAKVICRSGKRNPNVVQDGSRELITVVESISVGGTVLPSWVIYKGRGHDMGWHTSTDDPEAVFSYSDNGWTDDKLGLMWLRDHFDVYSSKISGTRPRLLVMDGHGSHLTYEFSAFAYFRNIHLICLPPHSTHLLQPLDVGLFGPLQHYYGKAADTHLRETRTGITKGTFWTLFTEARAKAYTKQSIIASFRATGIYPLNPDKVITKVKPKSTITLTPIGQKILLHKHLKTPQNRRDWRQQTQFALQLQRETKPGSERDEISALITRLSHLAERSLTEVEIAKQQLQDIRTKYEGKRRVKADRRILSKAQVITGTEIMKLKSALQKRESEKARKMQESKDQIPGRKSRKPKQTKLLVKNSGPSDSE